MWGESIIMKVFPALLQRRLLMCGPGEGMRGVRCRLCGGTGDDLTGMAINGWPQPVCVRCGGYGTIPAGCDNPAGSLTDEEIGWLTSQKG